MRHLQLAASLALIVHLAGCTSAPALRPVEPVAGITYKDFAENIAVPALELMAAISAFHAANHQIPADREALAAFASRNGAPVRWERFSRFEMANSSEGSALHVSITSPSSLSETGEIRTSWRLFFTVDAATPKKLHVSVSPQSSFCLSPSPGSPIREGSPSRERTKVELFLELLAYRPMRASAQETPLCLKSSEGRPSSSMDKRLKQKLDQMLRKQLRENSTSL